jgi:succinoglycan biosynthesis transport protein ExoP
MVSNVSPSKEILRVNQIEPHTGTTGHLPKKTDLSVANLVMVCRRRAGLIMFWMASCVALTAFVVFNLEPRYRAETELMLDTRIEHLGNFQSVISGPMTMQDPTFIVSSEVKVLESAELAGRVIDQLHLGQYPDFQQHPSLLSTFIAALTEVTRSFWPETQPVSNDPDRTRAALIRAYLGRLGVYNDGRSFVLSLSFDASDPALAARILNTHAQLYIADQKVLKQSAGRQALTWVDSEIVRLRTELDQKERALRDFRENAGLIAVPVPGGKDGTLVTQQIVEVGTDLAQARADLARREARLAQAQTAAIHGASSESDVLNSPLIQRLREQESTAQQRVADLTEQYGRGYPGLREAQARALEVDRRIAQEIARITREAENDESLGRQRVAQLSATMNRLQEQLIVQDKASARLSEMDRDIAATRQVFQGLLARQQEISAEVGAEDADARLVFGATAPLVPVYPNKTMFLGFAVLLSAFSGVGLAYTLDRQGSGIDNPEHLESLGVLTMHSVPLVPRNERRNLPLPDLLLKAPKVEFAEAIRALRGDIALASRNERAAVVALASALPQEGKTTVAVSLARSAAASGLQVLLIDCDLRRPAVTRALGLHPNERGIVSVLSGSCSLEAAVGRDPATFMSILAVEEHVASPQDLLSKDAIKALLDEARSTYDLVILDTPPRAAVSDILLIAPHVDATVLLVRWKTTPFSIVTATLRAFASRGLPISGIFLNAVDGRRLAQENSDLGHAYRKTRAYYGRA